eukprot:SAG11_NODE_10694_length_811_cov_4.998596_1_plen_161_part_10
MYYMYWLQLHVVLYFWKSQNWIILQNHPTGYRYAIMYVPSALTGEATFSCILCFYKYFSTVGFTTSEQRYGIRAIPYRYSGKSRTYKNFEKKTRPIRACSRGGTTVRKTYYKMIPLSFYHRVSGLPKKFCQTSRAKNSIDTKAQKLLRPVLESAAQGLSRT